MITGRPSTVATQDDLADSLDVTWIRSQFPALAQTVDGQPAVFLDGPGGTQVPQRVIDAISGYFETSNANTDGAFATSQRTDAMLLGARSAMADFLGCGPEEVIFGANMTSLTFALSRALASTWRRGDRMLVMVASRDPEKMRDRQDLTKDLRPPWHPAKRKQKS